MDSWCREQTRGSALGSVWSQVEVKGEIYFSPDKGRGGRLSGNRPFSFVKAFMNKMNVYFVVLCVCVCFWIIVRLWKARLHRERVVFVQGISLAEVIAGYWHGGDVFLGMLGRRMEELYATGYGFIEGYSSLSCVLEVKLMSVFKYGNHTGLTIDYCPTMLVSSIILIHRCILHLISSVE